MTTLVLVPDLGVAAEFFVEDADGARAADIVGHEDIDIDPDILAGRRRGALPACLARIFSVMVMPGIGTTPEDNVGYRRRIIAGERLGFHARRSWRK